MNDPRAPVEGFQSVPPGLGANGARARCVGHTCPSMPSETLPSAQTVLVPIANPETAPALLSMGRAMLGSGSGRVVALVVVTGEAGAEEQRDMIQRTERLVEALQWGEEIGFDHVTRTSPSVSRGVLDVALDEDADVVLLGVRQRRRSEFELGPVVEAVMAAAAADVVIARIPPSVDPEPEWSRLVVPVDGSIHAKAAVEMALAVGTAGDVPVEVVHVVDGEVPRSVGHAVIAATLEGTDAEDGGVAQKVVVAASPAEGILARTTPRDLIVIGASSGGALRHWLHAPVSTELLRRAPCPVLAVSRRTGRNGLSRAVARFRPTLTEIEKDSVVWHAQSVAGPTVDYMVLMVVSSVLAALGLLQDSPAVVIGAMLVAPLLGPLTAVSVGLATARLLLVRKAGATILIGSLLAVACAVLVGLLIPVERATAEMVARGSPSLLDAGVALAAGVVGAYATARKDIPAALAGVAIAAALVPPVCTLGLGLAVRDPDLARGALLLFAANIVSVSVVGAGVLWWLGMRFERRARVVRAGSVILVFVLALLSILVLLLTRQRAAEQAVARRDLEELFPTFEVVDLNVDGGDPIEVTATLRGASAMEVREVEDAERLLEEEVGADVRLSIVFEQVIRPD